MASNDSSDFSETTKAAKEQLDTKGWAVVDGVISPDDCDQYVRQLTVWKNQFQQGFPSNLSSVIHKYNICHHEVPWQVRLKSRQVFAGIWGTEKLLSSCDGIAIGSPPERGLTKFDQRGVHTLHHDQGPSKRGLHSIQGAVYLEEALQDDWCFAVLENSHKFHQDFFKEHPRNQRSEFRKLNDQEVAWYADRSCPLKRLAVPKGGIVLWDSRTVHMGAPAMFGRQNPGRWRYIVFVCMAPAIWASAEDLAQKAVSYHELRMTNHWPANGTSLFRRYQPHKFDITQLPSIAKTTEAHLLAGVQPYDFEDGQPNGPKWTPLTVEY